MAHNVRIEKLQKYAKDGHPLPNRYRYTVRCKRCGSLTGDEVTSAAVAESIKDGHHSDIRSKYQSTHPHDKRQKSAPTRKRVQKKMVKLRG